MVVHDKRKNMKDYNHVFIKLTQPVVTAHYATVNYTPCFAELLVYYNYLELFAALK